jgi:hypothetical protein
MIAVQLEMEEWQRLLAIVAQAPWATANPLIMAIGEQLRVRSESAAAAAKHGNGGDPEAAPLEGRSE